MPVIDLFAPHNFIRATLLDTVGKTTMIDGQTVPADAVALVEDRIAPMRDGEEVEGWPVILYSGKPDFERYAEEAELADGEYSIYMMMREDEMPNVAPGVDIETFCRRGYIAIFAAFNSINNDEGFESVEGGTIHGCEILEPWHRLYGEVGHRICEMGVIARIVST